MIKEKYMMCARELVLAMGDLGRGNTHTHTHQLSYGAH